MTSLWRLTGGRPMVWLGALARGDGTVVTYWIDRLGRRWMARSAWAKDRVRLDG